MKPRGISNSPVILLLWTLVIGDMVVKGLKTEHRDQPQVVTYINRDHDGGGAVDEGGGSRMKRDSTPEDDLAVTTKFHLNDSHLNLMVHWAGQSSRISSSIVFCLAKDQEMNQNSTSRVFISDDYATTFEDVSGKFKIKTDGSNATINKFFHHPNNNCYYVFTDILKKYEFLAV